MKHSVPVCTLVTAGVILGGITVAQALAAPPQKKAVAADGQAAGSDILRRLQELEAQVAQFREETARLRAELAQRQEGVPAGEKVGAGGTAARPIQRQEPAPSPAKAVATKSAAAGGEWDEPEVDKKAEGRDEEARRRLLALETQGRKNAAEAAKREEEQKDKVRFDFSGKYKAKLNSRHNFDLDNPRQTWKYDDASYFDHRFSLQVDAAYESLLTRLVLDKGNFVFDWKEDSEGTLERWGQFQTAGSPLVRELFVQYTGPFMLRAGRQSWDVGNAIVLEGPMDGVRFQYPFGQLAWGQTTLSAGVMAIPGGWGSYANFLASGGPPAGNRQEIFGVSNKLEGYYADLDIRPSRALRIKPYLLKVTDRGAAGDADLNLDKDFNAVTLPRDGGFRPLWSGVSISADFKTWKFDGEVVLLSGDYTANRKLRADALLLKAIRDFGKTGSLANLSAGLEFGRGSGNGTNDNASGTLRNFNALFMCRERHKFGNIFSEDIRAGYYFWDSNLANITYARANATLEPFKGLKVIPSVTRIWTTREVFEGRGPVFDWSRGAATSIATTKDVGWEIDLDMNFPLYKRVDGFFSLGHFRPGAVYARPDGSDPKPAWEIVLGAEVKF